MTSGVCVKCTGVCVSVGSEMEFIQGKIISHLNTFEW